MTINSTASRRTFIKQAAGLGGVAAIGLGSLVSSSEVFAQMSGDSQK